MEKLSQKSPRIRLPPWQTASKILVLGTRKQNCKHCLYFSTEVTRTLWVVTYTLLARDHRCVAGTLTLYYVITLEFGRLIELELCKYFLNE